MVDITTDCLGLIAEQSFLESPLPDASREESRGRIEIKSLSIEEASISPASDSVFLTVNGAAISGQLITSTKHQKRLMNSRFKMILFEEGLRGLAALYLSVGILVGAVYLCRRILPASDVANTVWGCVGLIKCSLTISVVVLALCYKLLLYNNISFVEPVQPENSVFFSTVMVISFAASWGHLMLSELRNFVDVHRVLADLFLPISQMIFTMVCMMIIADLAFTKISASAPTKFYVIYKAAAVLLFIECINDLIFHVLDIESVNLRTYMSINLDYLNDTFCSKKKFTNNFLGYLEKIDNFLHVFTVIFFVSCLAILLKPLRQFFDSADSSLQEKSSLLAEDPNEGSNIEQGCGRMCSYFVVALLLGLLACIGIPLDIVGQSTYPDMILTAQIAFNAVPICVHLFVSFYSVYFIKLLLNNFPIMYDKAASKVDTTIVWVSLCGLMISSFKSIINSAQFIVDLPASSNGTNETISQYRSNYAVHITGIVLFATVILQSLLQAMLIDFINNMRQKDTVSKQIWKGTMYPAIFLLSANIGFFITNWYLLSGQASFGSSCHPFSFLLRGILCTISDPFTLLFRGHCIMFMFRFISTLKYHNDNIP